MSCSKFTKYYTNCYKSTGILFIVQSKLHFAMKYNTIQSDISLNDLETSDAGLTPINIYQLHKLN